MKTEGVGGVGAGCGWGRGSGVRGSPSSTQCVPHNRQQCDRGWVREGQQGEETTPLCNAPLMRWRKERATVACEDSVPRPCELVETAQALPAAAHSAEHAQQGASGVAHHAAVSGWGGRARAARASHGHHSNGGPHADRLVRVADVQQGLRDGLHQACHLGGRGRSPLAHSCSKGARGGGLCTVNVNTFSLGLSNIARIGG